MDGVSEPQIRTMRPTMPALAAKTKASQPLSPEEQRKLEAALATLRSELRAVVGSLPAEGQTASGMARLLGVERSTCQRVVSAVSASQPAVELAAQLPGTRGLTNLLDAAAGLDSPPEQAVLKAARQAVRGYDALIRGLAGSQSRLIGRIRISGAAAAPGQVAAASMDDASRALFDAASLITGRSSDLWLAVHVFTPDAARPGLILDTRAHGLLGHRAADDAVPLTMHIFGDDSTRGDAPGPDRFLPLRSGRNDALLKEFSTDPAPIVRSRSPGEAVVQTVEDSPGRAGPIDLVFGLEGAITHPATREHRVEEVWALVNFPVRRLLFDVYLHRELARGCIPALDHHLWRPDFASQVGERWQTRFAKQPTLTMLQGGIDEGACDAYPRYSELVAHLFAARNENPAAYVGYRCEVAYPVWRTGYRLSLDFGEPA